MLVKREFWPSLRVDSTLASLLTIKMANKESSLEPPADLMINAKKELQHQTTSGQ